tara:strand:- start:1333 stop:1500 length:168 start_codon:yes stop_codon:yes gene_type:complete
LINERFPKANDQDSHDNATAWSGSKLQMLIASIETYLTNNEIFPEIVHSDETLYE